MRTLAVILAMACLSCGSPVQQAQPGEWVYTFHVRDLPTGKCLRVELGNQAARVVADTDCAVAR